LSPLVQVRQTPVSVISHLQSPIVRLTVQRAIPFIIRQQLHKPPESILQRFCIMLAAVLSSQVQVIFKPPLTFSILKVQRGTINMLVPEDMVPGAVIPDKPVGCIVGILIPTRSIIMFTMTKTPFEKGLNRRSSQGY
jgi:hypothetical protein